MRCSRRRFLIKQAVIFVGGEGSRLKKLKLRVPKPLIKIENTPILKLIINDLERYKFKEFFIMCVDKNLNFYKNFFKKYHFDAKINLISEKKPTGTLGALKKIINKCDEYFLICNGDTLHNFDLREFKSKFAVKKYCSLLVSHKKNFYKEFDQKTISKKSNFVGSGIYIINKKKIKIIIKKNLRNFEDLISKKILNKNLIDIQKQKNKIFFDIGSLNRYKKKDFFYNQLFKKNIIILDRDGIINYDYGYVNKIKNFIFTKFIFRLIRFFNEKNFYVFVITNQSGIGRGYYTEKDLKILHDHMNLELFKKGCNIDKIYFSPYYKLSKNKEYRIGSNFRKPKIGFYQTIKKEWRANNKKTLFIGDKATDKIFAYNAKISFIMANPSSNFIDIAKKIKERFKLNG